eukprot:3464441-Prymnesium_polylepis.1
MLASTPLYRGRKLKLYLRDEIDIRKLDLHNRQVCLYVSNSNNGAAALATELTSCFKDANLTVISELPGALRNKLLIVGKSSQRKTSARSSFMIQKATSFKLVNLTARLAKRRSSHQSSDQITHSERA